MLVVDFDKLHFGELFEIFCQRTRDVVERAIRLAGTGQIDMGNAVGEGESAVAGETVEDQRESLITLNIAGTLEEFIEHRTQEVFVGGDETRRGDLIRKLAADQPIVIGKVDLDLHIQGRARG